MHRRPAVSFLTTLVLLAGFGNAAWQPAFASGTASPEVSWLPGSSQATITPGESAADDKKSGEPTCKDANLDLIYPVVGASYVGGTIPKMPFIMSRGLGRILPYQVSQYRVKGKLAMGPCGIVFAFQAKEDVSQVKGAANYDLLPCGSEHVLLSERAKEKLGCRKTTNTDEKCTHDGDKCVIQVLYAPINTLSRARKLPSELSADTTAFLTTAAAILTAILGSFTVSHDKLVYGGVTVAAGMVAYILLIKNPAQSENYMAVFVPKGAAASGQQQPAAVQGTGSGAGPPTVIHTKGSVIEVPQAPSKASGDGGLFKKGDVMVFKIRNYHDYYNISMIPSGETGLEFVAESAEQTSK
jgi:hypothetical protein